MNRIQFKSDLASILMIGLPLVFNNLASIAVNVADTLMASQLGTTQLAAVAIGSGVWIALFLMGLGIIMAVGPTVAQHFGAGRFELIGRETRQGLVLGAFLSLIVIFIMRTVEPLLLWMKIDPEVSNLAQGYLNALSWGVLAAYGYHTLKQMTEGVGRTIPIMVVMGVMLPINIGINYVLMFGKLGFDSMGAVGCGFGNAVSFWLMFFMLANYSLFSKHYKKFNLRSGKFSIEWRTIRRLVSLGLPIGMSLFLQSGLFTTVALLMASLGTIAVAAHQVVLSYSGLVFMIPLGLAMALTVCVGQAVGRGDIIGAGRIGYVGIVACTLLSCLSAVTTFWLGPVIAGIYTQDEDVLRLSITLFKLAAFLQLGDGIQVAGAFALRGLKDTRVPLILNAINYWGFGFVFAYILGVVFEFGATGVWAGLSFALISAAFLMVGRFIFLTRGLRAKESKVKAETRELGRNG